MEPGAVVCRVSPAFIRFGTFQLPSTRPEDLGLVRQLADYTIRHHYPHLEGNRIYSHRNAVNTSGGLFWSCSAVAAVLWCVLGLRKGLGWRVSVDR
jgi:uncharacterized protein YdiU (UPF0061 family)